MIELREVCQRGMRSEMFGMTAATVTHFVDFAMKRIPLANRLFDFPMAIQAECSHARVAPCRRMARGTVVRQLCMRGDAADFSSRRCPLM